LLVIISSICQFHGILGQSTTTVKVEGGEIGVGDRDQLTPGKMTPLVFPAKVTSVLEADNQQKVVLKFALKDNKGQSVTPHQVFVRFLHEATKEEIVFVVEPDSTNKEYKFDLTLATRAKDFNSQSGTYDMSLIVGDFNIANPFEWTIATVKLSFPPGGEVKTKPSWAIVSYEVKPEIKHLFREPEKRPPTFVSDLFSLLVLAPFLLLLGLWLKIGVNVKNLPVTLSALLFHSGLALIFSLFFLFWLKMDMFTTLKCLSGVTIMTFLSGHSLLKTLSKAKDDH
jgi:oligosaccharyltransferase complex subunit delta (ribophorin II)